MGSVLTAYDRRRDAGEIRPDAAQRPVIERLDGLAQALAAMPKPGGLFGFLKKAPEPPQGLYIHGEVGRGKTMLMDLFFGEVQVAPKRRVISTPSCRTSMRGCTRRDNRTRRMP